MSGSTTRLETRLVYVWGSYQVGDKVSLCQEVLPGFGDKVIVRFCYTEQETF